MDWNVVLNFVFGGGLLAALVALVTLRATVREAEGKADHALAEAETVKITNTEQATRILIQNIVEPLKKELDETRKELIANRRESVRLRAAINGANSCRYSADCPVLERMRSPKERDDVKPRAGAGQRSHRQRTPPVRGKRDGAGGGEERTSDGADVVGEPDDPDGQPPSAPCGGEL